MSEVKKWPHICAECGEPFVGYKSSRYCSRKCAGTASGAAFAKKMAVKAAEKVDERRSNPVKTERELRLARLAARDAAYAAAFPSCASGELRGRVSAGGRVGICGERSEEIVTRWIAR